MPRPHADDTTFYRYRAIESLRHHCAALHDLTAADKAKQWQEFRAVCGCDEHPASHANHPNTGGNTCKP